MPQKESCDKCYYWKQEKTGQVYCHRYPPNPDGKAGAIDKTGQPGPDWWCGEFKKK